MLKMSDNKEFFYTVYLKTGEIVDLKGTNST